MHISRCAILSYIITENVFTEEDPFSTWDRSKIINVSYHTQLCFFAVSLRGSTIFTKLSKCYCVFTEVQVVKLHSAEQRKKV